PVVAHRIATPPAPAPRPAITPAQIAPAPQLDLDEAPPAPPTMPPTPSEPPPMPSTTSAYSSRLPISADGDSALVVSAVHAISARDDRAAIALLDTYVAQNPDGDLIEESLALEIEARSRLDDATAASFADRYLARFPTGRFRDTALRAAARFVKHPVPGAH